MGVSSEPDTAQELTSASPSSAQRTKQRYRAWSALLAFAAPALLVLGSWLLLRGALPERVAFHWDASGRPDGQVPTGPLFWGCLALSVVLFVFGVLTRFTPSNDQQDTRKAVTLVGCVAGLVAAVWLVPAITTGLSASTSHAGLNGWLALFVVGLAYGAVTRWVTPPERVDTR